MVLGICNKISVFLVDFIIVYLADPLINEIIKRTIKIKNRTFAIPAEAPAIPPKPKTPAIIAIIINVIVQRNIIVCF